MKKVLIITYYWPPSGGAGVQRWVKFAKYLSQMGVEPIVLTVDPKHATYPQIDETLLKDVPNSVKVYHTKSFELYSLYKKVSTNKEVPYGGFANTKKVNFKEKVLRFIRGNFFLPDPRRGWNRYAISKAKEIIAEHNIDTVITTSPPHSTQLIGLKLKKQLGIKWIADFRDPWTDIFYYKLLYPTKLASWLNRNLERKTLLKSDKVITVSDDLKRLFSEKSDKITDKIIPIPNGFDPDDFTDIKNLNEEDDLFYISYVGTISNDYTIDGFLNGLSCLEKHIKDKIKLRFVGKLSEDYYTKIIDAGLEKNIERIGYVSHKEAINYMCSSNILLLIIPNISNNGGILTGKLFEYIASGRPILFIGPKNGDAAEILRNDKNNMICSYDESDKIAQYITKIYTDSQNHNFDLPLNSRTSKYSRDNLTKVLLDYL